MKRSNYYQQLRGRLGVSRIRDDHDLAVLVEKQLPASAIRSLVSSGLSDAEVYALIVPRRTLAHRLTKSQPLTKDESDKAVRVARVTALAEHVFGEPARAWRWMRKPKRQFEGKTAMEMLSTEAGARLVEELIVQVEHGMGA
jgi:putative toxin-antitoxin system antitoxin component (TIGR02293 family)